MKDMELECVKAQLIEKMKKYNFPDNQMRLNSDGKFCGYLLLEGNQVRYKSGQYIFNSITYAFEFANEIIDKMGKEYIQAKTFADSHCDDVLETQFIYYNTDNFGKKTSRIATFSNIDSNEPVVLKMGLKQGNVSVVNKTKVRGTIDQLREFIGQLNNRLRYCNGCYYKIEDEKIVNLMNMYSKWSLYKPYSDFEEYYRNSTVD